MAAGRRRRRAGLSAVFLAATLTGGLSGVAGGGVTAGAVARPRSAAPFSARSGPSALTSAIASAKHFPVYLTYVYGVACPTASTCYAVGGTPWGAAAAAKTTDGGARWSSLEVPVGVAGLASIACPSSSDCVAIGAYSTARGVAIVTSDGGRTWTAHPMGNSYFLERVACPTTTECWAVGGGRIITGGPPAVIVHSDNGGASWTEQATSRVTNYDRLQDVSCPTASICSAAGETGKGRGVVLGTTDGGQTWAARVHEPVAVTGISCATATDCSGVTYDATIVTTDGGTTWQSQKLPSEVGDISAIGCEASARCLAVGINKGKIGPVALAQDGSAAWKLVTLPKSDLVALGALACRSGTCLAAGGTKLGFAAMLSSADGGASWKLRSLPHGVDYLRAGSCPTAEDCYFGGSTSTGRGDVVSTTDGGKSWTSSPLPSPTYIMYSVSCRDASNCIASGITSSSTGVLVQTNDGGASWSVDRIPDGIGSLVGSACWSAADCIAVGRTTAGQGAVLVTSDGGTTWKDQSADLPLGTGYLNDITCPASGTCVAAGGTASSGALIVRTTDGGTSWTSENVPSSLTVMYSVSCPSTTACYAVGGYVTTLTISGAVLGSSDGGQTWTMQPVAAGVEGLSGLACASATDCAAAGSSANGGAAELTTSSSGSSWSASFPASLQPLNGVVSNGTDWWYSGTDDRGAAVVQPAAIDSGSARPSAAPDRATRTSLSSSLSAVPKGFKANSTSWISPTHGFVLGRGRCGTASCTAVISTTDGGSTWSLLGTVPASIRRPSATAQHPGVTEVRMTSARVGYVYGDYLFGTTDGGRRWQRLPVPGSDKQVLAVAGNKNVVFAVTSACTDGSGCPHAFHLWRDSDPGAGTWHRVSLSLPGSDGAGVEVAKSTVYVNDPPSGPGAGKLYVSSDDGTHFASRTIPCSSPTRLQVVSPVTGSASDVGALCVGSVAFGEAAKEAWYSTDAGLHWSDAGALPMEGGSTDLAVAPGGSMVAGAWSVGSFLDYTAGNGTWTKVAAQNDSAGWGDLTLTNASDGAVVWGPLSDSNFDLGQLFVTSDGGQHWSQVKF